jgi:hypothetical protein
MIKTFRPQHIIVSDTIERNGYRGLTLSLMPHERFSLDGKENISFITVVGGAQKYPLLKPTNFWEITGDVFVRRESAARVVWEECYIDITSYRKLGKTERRKQAAAVNKMWTEYYASVE